MRNQIAQNWVTALRGSAAILLGIGVSLFAFVQPLVFLWVLAALVFALVFAALASTLVLASRVECWASAAGYRQCRKLRFQARAFVWMTILGVYALVCYGFLKRQCIAACKTSTEQNKHGARTLTRKEISNERHQ